MNSPDDSSAWSCLGATDYKDKLNKIENKIYEKPDRLDDTICRAIMP